MIVTWSNFFDNYTTQNVEDFVNTFSGVYTLWVQYKTGQWKCFYVGQAINIETRLLEHLSQNEENDCIKNHVRDHRCGFYYAQVERQSDRDNAERSLYECYAQPECNQIVPSGNIVPINLP